MIWSFIKIALFVAAVAVLTLAAGHLADQGSGLRLIVDYGAFDRARSGAVAAAATAVACSDTGTRWRVLTAGDTLYLASGTYRRDTSFFLLNLKGTESRRARVWASSVLPVPVGPMSRMFDFSSSTSPSLMDAALMRL